MSSKYLKDLGHAVVDTTDGNNIIQALSLEGIFDLSLSLLERERRSLVTMRGYDAAAITYGEAKEGSIEAHNFSEALPVTSLRSTKGKGTEEGPVPTPSLAQSVYSIGTSQSQSTRSTNQRRRRKTKSGHKKVAIDGMDMLSGDGKGAMLFLTASMEEVRKRA